MMGQIVHAVLLAALLVGCAATSPGVARSATATRSVDRLQQECLALALYWEARGEGQHGMTAVGWTVLNRVQSPDFPSTVCAVVYEGGERPGCQFSWYCDGRSDRPRDWQSWQRALDISAGLLLRPPADPTYGARFYHANTIATPWRRQRERTTQIGSHVFYR